MGAVRVRGGVRVSIRPEGRGVLQPSGLQRRSRRRMSQSVPRDGGYCNAFAEDRQHARAQSQSVPRDGGYCNWNTLYR